MGHHLRAVQNDAVCHSGGFIVSAAGTKQSPLCDFLSNMLCEINLLTHHFFQSFKQEKSNVIHNKGDDRGSENKGLMVRNVPGTCHEFNTE